VSCRHGLTEDCVTCEPPTVDCHDGKCEGLTDGQPCTDDATTERDGGNLGGTPLCEMHAREWDAWRLANADEYEDNRMRYGACK